MDRAVKGAQLAGARSLPPVWSPMRVHSYNERAKPFAWTKTADQVLKKANRQTTSNARH